MILIVQDNKIKQETWFNTRNYSGCSVIQKNASHKYFHCEGEGVGEIFTVGEGVCVPENLPALFFPIALAHLVMIFIFPTNLMSFATVV